MRISDWSSDVCSSDLFRTAHGERWLCVQGQDIISRLHERHRIDGFAIDTNFLMKVAARRATSRTHQADDLPASYALVRLHNQLGRSEEHTSELQTIMRTPSPLFCLKRKKHTATTHKPERLRPHQHTP